MSKDRLLPQIIIISYMSSLRICRLRGNGVAAGVRDTCAHRWFGKIDGNIGEQDGLGKHESCDLKGLFLFCFLYYEQIYCPK